MERWNNEQMKNNQAIQDSEQERKNHKIMPICATYLGSRRHLTNNGSTNDDDSKGSIARIPFAIFDLNEIGQLTIENGSGETASSVRFCKFFTKFDTKRSIYDVVI